MSLLPSFFSSSPIHTKMSMDAQPVNLGMSFSLPVNLAKIGTGYLSENPVAGVLLSLLAFFVFLAVLAVPISALFGVELFPGLLPHARYDITSFCVLSDSKALCFFFFRDHCNKW